MVGDEIGDQNAGHDADAAEAGKGDGQAGGPGPAGALSGNRHNSHGSGGNLCHH